mmetsp:Transcript_11792/g.15965  ORF Transcript_11792/g.15965 Transcript_11792/m.15965 type:complete len:450 (+) Transcript_11792:122-1471(+)|eukprot:CAMPEP_0196581804 /NCGR_PEP_ID=MMETSP1081-20130531/35684_1 /TAXON_ID=36882 /ORGANISM="Pyramimonas amylifera, Strain CCMP720" /LENGTH=449 /DNA_ID=CAMNT_0041902163 /DNA_START=121 /DNA_END=1470 /DNA_ORIENTATION=-
MNNVQAVLIFALLVAVFRVTFFHLSLPGPEGAQPAALPTTPAYSRDTRQAKQPEEDKHQFDRHSSRVSLPAADSSPLPGCEGNCPCVRRDRGGALSCPCWTHCIYTAPPSPSPSPKSGAELIEEMKEIINPRLGDPLPKAEESEREGTEEEDGMEVETDDRSAVNPKLARRLKKGQFGFAAKGIDGPYGDRSEGAIEAFTLLAGDNTNPDGTTQFTSSSGTITRTHFEPEIIASLPATDYPVTGEKVFRSCALVGNSGTLLGSKHGPSIDGHDAVMRINYAPIKGFEADVGSKTTFDFSNRENARRILKNGNVGWRDSTILFFEVSSPTNRRQMFVPLVKKFPQKRIHFIHPSFINRAMGLWFDMKKELEERRHTSFHDKPMSGFMAVLFMMQECRQLDLYGFEAYTKKRADSPYHYFDKVEGVTTVHSFDMAIDIYRMLGEVYPLSIK